MNFSGFSTWLESLGTREYSLPDNREERLFDFFLMEIVVSDINKRQVLTGRDEILKQDVNIVWEKILHSLRLELLDEVFYAIVSEMRHVRDMMNNHRQFDDDELFADLRYNTRLGNQRSAHHISELVERYSSVRSQFVQLAEKVFSTGDWKVSYGGKAWSDICKAWLRLYNAKSLGDIQVWIDHTYDLQHNTDTVFNKLSAYNKNGFDWITDSLNFKQQAKTGSELIPYASPIVQKLATEVLRKEPKPNPEPIIHDEKILYLNGKKLEFILSGRKFSNSPWYSYMIHFPDVVYSPSGIFEINQHALSGYERKNNIVLDPKLVKAYFDQHLFRPGVKFVRCGDLKTICTAIPRGMVVGQIFNDIDEEDFRRVTSAHGNNQSQP